MPAIIEVSGDGLWAQGGLSDVSDADAKKIIAQVSGPWGGAGHYVARERGRSYTLYGPVSARWGAILAALLNNDGQHPLHERRPGDWSDPGKFGAGEADYLADEKEGEGYKVSKQPFSKLTPPRGLRIKKLVDLVRAAVWWAAQADVRLSEGAPLEKVLPSGAIVRAQPGSGRKGAGWAYSVVRAGMPPFVSDALWKSPEAALAAGVRSETTVLHGYRVARRGSVSVLFDPARQREAEALLPPGGGTTIFQDVAGKTSAHAVQAWRRSTKADRKGWAPTMVLEAARPLRPLPRVRRQEAGSGPGSHPEARQHGDQVWVFPKFFAHGSEWKRHALAHELGHWFRQEHVELKDIMGWEPGEGYYDVFATPNAEEGYAEAFAVYLTKPSELRQRYPQLYADMEERVKPHRSVLLGWVDARLAELEESLALAFRAWASQLQEGLTDEGVLDALRSAGAAIKARVEWLSDLAKATKVRLSDLVQLFKDTRVYRIFAAVGWSMQRLHDLLRRGFAAYRTLLGAVAEYAAQTRVGRWTEDKLRGLDAWLQRHPKLARIGGLAVAGLLVYIWFHMTFTGDATYDFGMDDVLKALSGEFSLAKLFSGRDGMKLLMLFATGMLGLSFPWPGSPGVLFTASVVQSLARKFGARLRKSGDPVNEAPLKLDGPPGSSLCEVFTADEQRVVDLLRERMRQYSKGWLDDAAMTTGDVAQETGLTPRRAGDVLKKLSASGVVSARPGHTFQQKLKVMWWSIKAAYAEAVLEADDRVRELERMAASGDATARRMLAVQLGRAGKKQPGQVWLQDVVRYAAVVLRTAIPHLERAAWQAAEAAQRPGVGEPFYSWSTKAPQHAERLRHVVASLRKWRVPPIGLETDSGWRGLNDMPSRTARETASRSLSDAAYAVLLAATVLRRASDALDDLEMPRDSTVLFDVAGYLHSIHSDLIRTRPYNDPVLAKPFMLPALRLEGALPEAASKDQADIEKIAAYLKELKASRAFVFSPGATVKELFAQFPHDMSDARRAMLLKKYADEIGNLAGLKNLRWKDAYYSPSGAGAFGHYGGDGRKGKKTPATLTWS